MVALGQHLTGHTGSSNGVTFQHMIFGFVPPHMSLPTPPFVIRWKKAKQPSNGFKESSPCHQPRNVELPSGRCHVLPGVPPRAFLGIGSFEYTNRVVAVGTAAPHM